MIGTKLSCLACLLVLSAVTLAEPLVIESPAHRVHLLELYTSEGCSSCPPADRWLRERIDDDRLWTHIVPLGFHVDYWNYLGWQDRFARAAFSQRQRTWAKEQAVRTVYTPGFVVDGKEWRGWFSQEKLPDTNKRRTGALTVTIDEERLALSYAPLNNPKQLIAHVALLGFGLETAVKAGENAGESLRHDFVVLGIDSAPLEKSSAAFTTNMVLPDTDEEAERFALAAWVTDSGSQQPLQAIGTWLPPR